MDGAQAMGIILIIVYYSETGRGETDMSEREEDEREEMMRVREEERQE